MATLITQDFEFDVYSQRYGRFLVDACEFNATPQSASAHYPGLGSGKVIVTVDVSEDAASHLKLTYGDCLRTRPEIKFTYTSVVRAIDILNTYKEFYNDQKLDEWVNVNYDK